jgi:hypothetical protein
MANTDYPHVHVAPPTVCSLFTNLPVRYRADAIDGQAKMHVRFSLIIGHFSTLHGWSGRCHLVSNTQGRHIVLACRYKGLVCIVEGVLNSSCSPIELARLQHKLDQSREIRRQMGKTQRSYLGTGPRSL